MHVCVAPSLLGPSFNFGVGYNSGRLADVPAMIGSRHQHVENILGRDLQESNDTIQTAAQFRFRSRCSLCRSGAQPELDIGDLENILGAPATSVFSLGQPCGED